MSTRLVHVTASKFVSSSHQIIVPRGSENVACRCFLGGERVWFREVVPSSKFFDHCHRRVCSSLTALFFYCFFLGCVMCGSVFSKRFACRRWLNNSLLEFSMHSAYSSDGPFWAPGQRRGPLPTRYFDTGHREPNGSMAISTTRRCHCASSASCARALALAVCPRAFRGQAKALARRGDPPQVDTSLSKSGVHVVVLHGLLLRALVLL